MGVYAVSPGYSYLMAVLFKVFGPGLSSVVILQCFLSALACVLTYRIARRFFSASASMLAGLLYAGYGASVFYANLISKASWIEFLNIACLFTFLKAIEKPAFWKWLVPGALLGISAQFRPNILLFLPFLAGCIWFVRDGIPTSKRLIKIGMLLLGSCLIIFPVALRNRIVGGEWVLTTAHGGMNLYTGNNPLSAAPYRPLPFARTDPQYEQDDFLAEAEHRSGHKMTPGESSRFWYRETVRLIRSNVSGWLALLAKKTWLLWSNYEQPINQNFYLYREYFWLLKPLAIIGYWLIAPLGLFGFLLSLRNRALLPLHLYLFAQALGLVAFFVVSEYRHPMTPALVVFAAGAFDWFRSQISSDRNFWRKAVPAIILMLLAGLSTLGSTRQTLAYRQDLSVAYNNLGYACMVNKHWDEAVSPLKTSLAVLSSNAEAYYNLGECYMHLNRPGEAKDQILEGMRSRPGAMPPQHSRSTLARAYAGLGEFDQAAEEFRKALYSDPSDIEALFGLAVVYRQMGRSRQALALLEEYFSVHPADQQGLILAIDLAMSVKDSSKALGMLPRLSSVAADDPAVYDFMGKVLASAGRYQEAKNEFERALALAPDSISVKADLERLKQILSTAGLR